MTYNELRDAIAENLTNQAALLGLLNPANVETVERCAPGVATSTQSYVPGNRAQAYQAGLNVAVAMYDDKQPVKTVDQVLDNFTSGNIYAAKVYGSISSAVANGNVTTEFFDATESVANQIQNDLC